MASLARGVAVSAGFDRWGWFARRRLGASEQWGWVTVERVVNGDLVRGGVYSTTIKTGPRKGQPNFKKPDPGTELVFVVPETEFGQLEKEFEVETGRCAGAGCESGRVPTGWSVETGPRYAQCARCAGTGNAPAFGPNTPGEELELARVSP